MSRFIDAYEVLGVQPDASQAALKARHRELVRRHHPDLLPPGERPAATRRMQEINVAYGLVRDPRSRTRYDRLRRLHRAEFARTEMDRRLAAQWEVLVQAAGRWATRWWQRNRRRLRRAGVRARRAGIDAAGRVLWLVSALAGAVIGAAVGVAGQQVMAIDGQAAPLAGGVAGALVGSQRGWHRRLRLAGIHVEATARWVGLAVAAAAVAAGLWLDAAV